MMKSITIAKTIITLRKERGLTQDDIASYIGVSKASVSKWETGLSYPDITLLPQLASYFNISIDDLMGYKPQMSKADIRKLYERLCADFATKPFDEVTTNCREIIKKYYSCFPLLFQIGALFVNYSTLLTSADKTTAIITEAKELFIRVKEESRDIELIKQAQGMEAICALTLGNPEEVLELLGATNEFLASTDPLLASAYEMTGQIKEAKTVLQVGLYQHIINLFALLPLYLRLCTDDIERFEEISQRTLGLIDVFHITELHPSLLLNFHYTAAGGYLSHGQSDKALDALEKYTTLVTNALYPLELKGDEFFNLLDDWLDDFPLGTALPRDEATVKKDIAAAIINNPTFSSLAHHQRFQSILERLKNNC